MINNIFSCFRIFYISYVITIASKNTACLFTSCHLMVSLLNIFRTYLHLMVKLIKHVYRCIKLRQSNNTELNETLINKEDKLFELSDQNENDDYSTYEYNKLNELHNINDDNIV